MSWVRLDDAFHSHPKVRAAGDRAVGAYVRALCYANAYRTAGRITPADLRALHIRTADAAR